MALSAEELGRMTLTDLEALAERFGKAVDTIREARALLGGAELKPAAEPRPPPSAPVVALEPAEMAERDRLMRQFREGLPDNIRHLEEQ